MNDLPERPPVRSFGACGPLRRLVRAGDAPGPEAEKSQTQAEYDAYNRRLNQLHFGKYAFFLNYGYIANENPSFARARPATSDFDIPSRRLVLEVIGDCPIDGLDVLDVSCGRGSVPMTLRDFYQPRSYLGIDLSAEAIRFCREHHPAGPLTFQEGDAESLPLPDQSWDVAINIEASHTYPRIRAFYDEVVRVLRPGGWFLYTDVLSPRAFEENSRYLGQRGLTKTRDVDITSNVLLACADLGPRRLKAYRDPNERARMANFLAAPGSAMYQAMEQRALCYRLLSFQKAGRPHSMEQAASGAAISDQAPFTRNERSL